VPTPNGFSVRRVDGFARIDVHAHVREHGLHAWWPEDDLRLTGPKPM
jgi:hypothetical protein